MLSISIIEQGNIDIEYFGSQNISLSNDSIAIFNPNIIHKAQNTTTKVSGYWVIYFDRNWCIDIQKELFNIDKFILIDQNIIKDIEQYIYFLNLCKTIYYNNNISYEDELKQFIIEIFLKYCNLESIDNKSLAVLEDIKQFITKNIDQSIRLEDIAIHSGYSTNHIIKLFNKYYGITPNAFILNQKVNYAKMNMIKHNCDLATISTQSGFYDQSHFCKNFKKVFGISPNKCNN